MKLVIVESPTKAVTIGKFLGKEYRVESSYGHIRDLPRSRFGINLETFMPEYIVPIKARKRVAELKKLAQKASEIVLASDEDREGEAIAWHIKSVLETPDKKTPDKNPIAGKPVSRIVFHEITETAIHNALAHPRTIDLNLVDAQQARRILDRVVGYKLSPFLWKKIFKGLSAGRVQSVALKLIVDRENEIKAFKPEEYWTIEALITEPKSKKTFEAGLAKINGKAVEKFEIKTKQQAETIAKDLASGNIKVAQIKKTEVKKNPLAPFTTSTLQQTASSRLGYSAKKTMMMAQRLYENGFITYMRTDAVNLSADSVLMAKNWLTKELGSEYALETPRVFTGKSKGAQEAHEAIRPTKMMRPEEMPVEEEAERKVYRLIWQRFVASQMPQAIFDSTQIEVEAKGAKDTYTLRGSGSMMKCEGFLKIYPQTFEEKEIPALTDGQDLTGKADIQPNQHFTEPPPRYSEAKLIKTLEEYGIGRPSTYVPIISVIQVRNYVKKEAGRFIPTDIGELVNKILSKHFPEIVDINFTAHMEEKFDEVAEGKEKWQQLLSDFYKPFETNLEKKYIEVDKEFEDEKTNEVCDCAGKGSTEKSECVHEGACGKPMIIKYGRFGKFLACSGFPDCKNTKNIAKPELLIGLKCPKCTTGDVIEKHTNKGRKRTFWGCNRYPECDWASWTNPLGKPKEKDETPETAETEAE